MNGESRDSQNPSGIPSGPLMGGANRSSATEVLLQTPHPAEEIIGPIQGPVGTVAAHGHHPPQNPAGFDGRVQFGRRVSLEEKLPSIPRGFGAQEAVNPDLTVRIKEHQDLARPIDAKPTQAEILSTYPPSQENNMDALGPDDFAQVPLMLPQ